MESLKKWNKRSEKVWLIISLISTVAAIVISIIDNFKDVYKMVERLKKILNLY